MNSPDKTENRRSKLVIILIGLIFSLFYLSYRLNLDKEDFPFAKKGEISYQAMAFAENGKLSLKGEWEFYWNKFYFPSDFKASQDVPPPGREFTSFPSAWYRIASRGDETRRNPSYGFATYRLKVTGLSPREKYALLVPVINSAYTLWINGERVLNSGLTGVDADHSLPEGRPRTVSFSAENREITLIFHISNYTHHRGGAQQNILLGRDDEVAGFDAREIIFSGMGILTSLMIVVFLLFLDIRYRKSHKEIFSILLFSALAMRISLSDSLLLLRLFPDIPWETTQTLKYIFTYAIGPLVMLVVSEYNRKRRSPLLFYLVLGTFCFLTLFILFSPAGLFTRFDLLFDIHQILCFAFTSSLLIDHVKNKKPFYLLHSIGTALFFLLFINMRLFMLGFSVTDEVSLSAILDPFFHAQFHTQSSTPFLVFSTFFPYFLILCFFFFSKIDYLMHDLREEESVAGSPVMYEEYGLTEREVDILEAVLRGDSNLEISEKCFISVGTVKNHLSHIYKKTNCSSRNKLNRLFSGHDSA